MNGLYNDERPQEEQREALTSGEVPVAVYGLGKMGLPVAAVMADVTGSVVGADVDPEVVEAIERGESPVSGEPGLPELVADVVDEGALRAVVDPKEAAAEAAIHVVIVPTLLSDDGEADLSALEAVLDDVATGLDPGDVVCVESTVPPRTCADVVDPWLAAQSGLSTDDFGVAFCPERTLSGRALKDIREAYPKVVGGVDPESTRVAALLYDHVTENDVMELPDATTAEAMKVFSGVYRDVNIALANEFARYADALGIDVRDAIDAANSQPHAKILSPGPGVGGHCIPVYPHFLLSKFDVHSPLTRIARTMNDSMSSFTVDLVRDGLDVDGKSIEDATVLLLGTTYRPGVAETRNSPAIPIAEDLAKYGADVYSHDPVVDGPERIAAEPVSLERGFDLDPDAVVLVTPHEEYASLSWDRLSPTIVVDCHDAFDLDDTDHVEYTIGSPRRRAQRKREHEHEEEVDDLARVTTDGGTDADDHGADADGRGRVADEDEQTAEAEPPTGDAAGGNQADR